jgi:hypothetical protein
VTATARGMALALLAGVERGGCSRVRCRVWGLDDGFISAVVVAMVLLTLVIAYLILYSVLAPFFGGG